MTIYDYFIYFYLYSFVGWFFESCYCSLRPKKWINRGFLRGPFCPIYGVGALTILICLLPFRSMTSNDYVNELLIFVVGMVVCDLVEYFTSFVMEKAFNARWWDYSTQPFNLHGRICLTHTLYWGTCSCLFLYVLHPLVDVYFVSQVNIESRKTLVYIITTVFVIDVINTIINALGLREYFVKFKELSDDIVEFTNIVIAATGDSIGEFSDERRAEFAKKLNEFKLRKDELFVIKKKKHIKMLRRLSHAFPFIFKRIKKRMENIDNLLNNLINLVEGKK
ncbi:MAG: putative ABC transporter permease [Clostridia bacterium]|nr:putative ABC transporter permease [Clostridia bacterium]